MLMDAMLSVTCLQVLPWACLLSQPGAAIGHTPGFVSNRGRLKGEHLISHCSCNQWPDDEVDDNDDDVFV